MTETTTSTISTADLRARLHDPTLTVVDLRPSAAYNGWRLGDEVRGGHIQGAVSFPGQWLESVDAAEIAKLFDHKGITAGRTVVLYGDDAADLAVFADRLASDGLTDVHVYADGFAAWAADPSLPVDRLPNYDKLVTTDWLAELLAGGSPEAAPTGKTLLFHVNFGVPEEYAENHIPGALYLDTNWLEDPADWNRRSPEALEAAQPVDLPEVERARASAFVITSVVMPLTLMCVSSALLLYPS